MKQHLWKDDAPCRNFDTNLFFEKYEDSLSNRLKIDGVCTACPMIKQCFAVGISGKEWGVWGGVYLEGGEISREFNNHKSKSDWADMWQKMTTD